MERRDGLSPQVPVTRVQHNEHCQLLLQFDRVHSCEESAVVVQRLVHESVRYKGNPVEHPGEKLAGQSRPPPVFPVPPVPDRASFSRYRTIQTVCIWAHRGNGQFILFVIANGSAITCRAPLRPDVALHASERARRPEFIACDVACAWGWAAILRACELNGVDTTSGRKWGGRYRENWPAATAH
eukprot:gene12382-biopygen7310